MNKALLLVVALSSLVPAQVTQQWMAVYNEPLASLDSVRNLVVD